MGKARYLTIERAISALELVRGSESGKRFDLTGDEIRIGRNPDNEIMLTGEGVSRLHATIHRAPGGGWMVLDNNSKNGVLVNAMKVSSCILKGGDIVQIGNHTLKFLGDEEKIEENRNPEPVAEGYEEQFTVKGKVKIPSKKSRRPLIYGSVLIFLVTVFYLMKSPEKVPTEAATQPDEQIRMGRSFSGVPEPDLKNTGKPASIAALEDPVLKKAESNMSKLDWNNSSLRESEQFFKKGQRDYLSKNYGRAIDAFQTALSLYKGHELADKYLGRSLFEAEQEAKTHMQIAISYFESLQYQRAIYHFSQVVNLMSHRPTEPIVVQAEKYIGISKKYLQSAELFP